MSIWSLSTIALDYKTRWGEMIVEKESILNTRQTQQGEVIMIGDRIIEDRRLRNFFIGILDYI